jgi:hypothetical protein
MDLGKLVNSLHSDGFSLAFVMAVALLPKNNSSNYFNCKMIGLNNFHFGMAWRCIEMTNLVEAYASPKRGFGGDKAPSMHRGCKATAVLSPSGHEEEERGLSVSHSLVFMTVGCRSPLRVQ